LEKAFCPPDNFSHKISGQWSSIKSNTSLVSIYACTIDEREIEKCETNPKEIINMLREMEVKFFYK